MNDDFRKRAVYNGTVEHERGASRKAKSVKNPSNDFVKVCSRCKGNSVPGTLYPPIMY